MNLGCAPPNPHGRLFGTIILLLIFQAAPASAIREPLRNVTPGPHGATTGSTLDEIGNAIEYAVEKHGWRVDSAVPGRVRASIWVRAKHHAVVDIGFNKENFWIHYVSSENLDYKVYDPSSERRPISKRGPGIGRQGQFREGPWIHKNFNRWVESLAKEIRIVVHDPPPPREEPAPESGVSVADELEKLHSLFERGVLTKEEFEGQKQKLLGR